MIDIQSLSYQTVSMPPSEVILQLWSTGMQNIRNTSWNFSVHNLNLTKPHSLSSGACKIKIFNGGADGLWCLVNVERLTSPLRGAWPEEVIYEVTPGPPEHLWCHLAGSSFFLGKRRVPFWGLERVSRVWTSINGGTTRRHVILYSPEFSILMQACQSRHLTASLFVLELYILRKSLCID